MTTAQIITANYEDAINNLPEEAILGKLLWFTISNADVNLEQARTDLAALGLDAGRLRGGFRPIDAFRKATNDFAHKFAPADSQRAEFLVRQVGQDSDQSHRHVVLERAEYASGRKRRVDYATVAELVFTRGSKDRKTGEYTGYRVQSKRVGELTPLKPEEEAWLDEHLATLGSRFDHMMTHLDSHGVRGFVRDYIASMHGILAKESGGLYFVLQEHAQDVSALSTWVESIGSSFHALPLLNMGDQRQMIMQALEDETVKEMDRLMEDVAGILKDPSRSITESTYNQFVDAGVYAQMRLAEYNKNLGERSDLASQRIVVFTEQLSSLAGRIKTQAVKR